MNDLRLTVGVALSARAWRGALQRHCRDHESDLAVVLLHDGVDALDGSVDVLVVDDDTSWLSVPFVQSARVAGVAMIGLFDPMEADGFGRQQLHRFGVDTTLECSIDSERLVETIRRHRRDPEMERRFAGLLADGGVEIASAPVGRVTAVGGPAGAGATEVCIALAANAAAGAVRCRPLVVDVDETHPTLARRLGLGLHPHLLTAVDVHRREPLTVDDSERTELRECVARPVDRGRPPLGFDVIAGLVTRDDWALVRPDDVVGLIGACSVEWPEVFVRLGPCLEDLQRHVGRYELSRRAASSADQIVGVCDASASGLLRFVDWLVDVVGLIGDHRVDVVMNRAPRSASQRAQLIDQLRSVAGDRVGEIVCAPTDRRVGRGSWQAEVPDWGPFRRSVAELTMDVDSPPRQRPWRRVWRSPVSEPTAAPPPAASEAEPFAWSANDERSRS